MSIFIHPIPYCLSLASNFLMVSGLALLMLQAAPREIRNTATRKRTICAANERATFTPHAKYNAADTTAAQMQTLVRVFMGRNLSVFASN